MIRILIFCYILVVAAAVCHTELYCSMNCTRNGEQVKHIACGHSEGFGENCPKNIGVIDFNNTLIETLLHEVNVVRNFVAGGANSSYDYKPACRMATIQWDKKLARLATLFPKECKKWDILHTYCHPTEDFPASGEFITDNRHLDGDIVGAVKAIAGIMITRTYERKRGDILADRNIRLGCGLTYAPTTFRYKREDYTTYWVACYFSTDIHDGDIMYEECKTAGEKCKNKPIARYPNLCAAGEVYE